MADAEKNFFNKNITADKTWCFSYDPETKQKSSELFGETSPQVKKLKFQRSMLIIFFNYQRIRTRGKNGKCRIF
jgi:hypothetical protein